MNILLTNDDGITSPGLVLLSKMVLAMGHVVHVAAPNRDWSGQSQSISLSGVLHAEPAWGWEPATAWAVDGSPADCVRIARALMGVRPDVVIAGINLGSNLGNSVYRSATIGAAREAALVGWPALALSSTLPLASPSAIERHLPDMLALALEEIGAVVNVNWPDGPALRRVLAEPAWGALTEAPVAQPPDSSGRVTVTMERAMSRPSPRDTTDIAAVAAGLVSVSILPVAPPAYLGARRPAAVRAER